MINELVIITSKELSPDLTQRLTRWLASEGFLREGDRVGFPDTHYLYEVKQIMPDKVLIDQLNGPRNAHFD